MKVSFVIPAYNEEKYLRPCLEAVLKLKRSGAFAIEVIVVNNASTDGTRAIIQSFPDVVLVDEPEKGLARARQAGFARATGELIANIDADTRVTESWLVTVLDFFSTRPRLAVLSGPFRYYDLSSRGNILVRFFYGAGFVMYLINRFVFRVGSLVQGGNFVVRASALRAAGGFDTRFNFYGEDADIARRLHKYGDVIFTFKLPIASSARRLKKEGYLVTAWRYTVNYFSTIFLKKAVTTEASAVRLKDEKS